VLPIALTAAAAVVLAALGAWAVFRSGEKESSGGSARGSESSLPDGRRAPEVIKAMEMEKAGAWTDALAQWLAIVRSDPSSTTSRAGLDGLIARVRAKPGGISAAEHGAASAALHEAAQLGSPAAMMVLGDGLRRADPPGALRWYSTAAQSGDAAALLEAGRLHLAGAAGVPVDEAKAVDHFRQAAARNDANAKVALAQCHLEGRGLPRDEARALTLLQEAADQGSAAAMEALASCHYAGRGARQDVARAAELFRRASDLGNLEATASLGVLLLNGEGGAADPAGAADLFQKGADAGHPRCMYLFARCLELGIGRSRDGDAAATWQRKAASAGNSEAQAWCRDHSVPF
jgi:TPR repeat protein